MILMSPSQKPSRHQRSAKSCPGSKIDLQFVNVKPDDPDQKTRETRTIVRANAAHFHWRHNRPPKDKAKAKTTTKQSRHGASVSRRDQRVSSPLLPMSTVQLGTDFDPFSSYDCKLPRALINHCIAFNAQFMLPALFPDGGNNFNIRSSLIQLSISNSSVLHMFVTGALINSQGIRGDTPSNRIALDMLQSRTEIVRGLNFAMQNPVEACKDINIFAVVALAKNEVARRKDVLLKTPKQGPLKNLQLINLLSLSEIDPVHYDGLSKLIELKGGLERIEIPGLAALISLGEILFATRKCTSPRFPVVALSDPTREVILNDHGMWFETDQDLYTVLSMLQTYTIMIDDFCEGRKVVAASVLLDQRNATQHALLSLSPRDGRSECYRLAALIYSLLVTFPLPYCVAPFKYLVTRLKIALAKWDGDGDDMLLWVLAIGGIGATGLDERMWFVRRFQTATKMIGLRSWTEAKDIIMRGLWHEATNDEDGQDLWLESLMVD